MLKCEDPKNADIALSDFFVDVVEEGSFDEYECFFEHGQLWIQHKPCGAQWSVNDGGDVSGNEYFVFDLVSQGDEEDHLH